MRRVLALSVAAAMLVVTLPAHAHPNYHYYGGCGFTTVSDGGDDDQTTWTGEAHVAVVATDTDGTPAIVPISVECDVYKNGVFQGTVLAASGQGGVASTAWYSYQAHPSDAVVICTRVSVGGEQESTCGNDSGLPGVVDGVNRFVFGRTGCDDGLDNDGDGYTDSADPGCYDPTDSNERGDTACDDGWDNDSDGARDYPADGGCSWPGDGDETGSGACWDGVDNDLDGRADYPDDPGCASYSDESEQGGPCDDGWDNDGDGHPDTTDPGCSGPGDDSERGMLPCDDGVDNDGDGYADDPDDPGCFSPTDPNETTIP